MVRVDWAKPALADLREIYEFIARDSSRYAQLTVEKITDATDSLARFPQLGEVLPEFPSSAYRQIVVGNYRLIYREAPGANRVLVIAIVHASRKIEPILEDR
ncbi:MAG TPA: type II toxin-antitoxin system RelE/ParE family toxin [Thermoguttaceae bacterium]|nr:type II toxin-antitoxin system RelE/ParE family toxin [Thermoguttaceae bacterium]